MPGRFSSYSKERFIAPQVSGFTEADIPDMTDYDPQSSHWVTNYFLNSIFRGRLKAPHDAYAHSFLRRAEGAFSEHDAARRATNEFLATEGRQSPSQYAAALLHWEFFLTQAWQGYALLMKLVHAATGDADWKVFEPGDGSVEERLNALYNSMKHVESRIAAGQILRDAIIPVWLNNEGIRNTDVVLTYTDTRDVLQDLAKWANVFQDPRETANKLRAME